MTIKKLLYAFVLPLLFLAGTLNAQDRTVTGTVTDTAGNPVVNASVVVKGGKGGTSTAANGTFSLKVPTTATALTISSVGFGAQTVSIGDAPLSVTLRGSNTALSEVVVVAYGTRRRADLTGSVTAVSAKDFQKGTITSSEQLLQGKVAGLQVTSGGGSAGGGSRLRIRGMASLNSSNDPLVVIDGVPVQGNSISGTENLLNTINPNDIESISVLKDASASALYGSRASNGVIIITTKKGTRGKVKWNFNTLASVATVAKKADVLTGDEVRSIINSLPISDSSYKKQLGTENTDWQDVIFKKAFTTDNNLSASGTIGFLPYRISGGYLNQEGNLRTDKFSRTSVSLNLSPKFLNDYLSVNLSLKYSHTKNRLADAGAIGNATAFDPTQPVYTTNKFGGYTEVMSSGLPNSQSYRNPLALLELRNNSVGVNRLIGNIQLDYKLHFLPDLHVLVNLGMDNASSNGNDIRDSISATDYRTHGKLSHYEQKKYNYLADVSLFYTKEIPSIKSRFDVLLGHSYQDIYTDVTNFPSYSLRSSTDTIPGSTYTFYNDRPGYRLEGYLGRLNYTLMDKYLLTASLRRDASSRFSPETRVGYFPAVSAAWRLKQEFFKDSRAITDLKIRAGYGVTGQQNIGNDFYNYLPRYSYSRSTASYQFGDSFYTFLRPAAYDRTIKWETTTTTNIALDFALFNNRVSGSIDFYKKKTRDMLSTIPVAPGSNFDVQLTTNVGNMENKGVEFILNTTPVRTKDFSWDFGFNVAYNETKITNLLKQTDPNFKGFDVGNIGGGTSNFIGKHLVGYSPYSYFVYKQVYDQNGKPIEGLYEDINRDGKVDELDRYLYKKPAPDVLAGLSTQFSYKKISLGLTGHASFGNYLYNNFNSGTGVLRNFRNPLGYIGNGSRDYFTTGFQNNRYLSDYYVENGSFFRLDNINVGYNVGKILRNSANLNITGSIQNVFTITKYKGLDPENSSDSGVDNNIYPRPRVYSVRFSIDF